MNDNPKYYLGSQVSQHVEVCHLLVGGTTPEVLSNPLHQLYTLVNVPGQVIAQQLLNSGVSGNLLLLFALSSTFALSYTFAFALIIKIELFVDDLKK